MTEPDELPAQCSRRGCRDAAAWALLWNNPKLHTPDRRKTWLACDEHRGYLADFLEVRGFLRSTEPFTGSSGAGEAGGGAGGGSPQG